MPTTPSVTLWIALGRSPNRIGMYSTDIGPYRGALRLVDRFNNSNGARTEDGEKPASISEPKEKDKELKTMVKGIWVSTSHIPDLGVAAFVGDGEGLRELHIGSSVTSAVDLIGPENLDVADKVSETTRVVSGYSVRDIIGAWRSGEDLSNLALRPIGSPFQQMVWSGLKQYPEGKRRVIKHLRLRSADQLRCEPWRALARTTVWRSSYLVIALCAPMVLLEGFAGDSKGSCNC